MQQINELLIAMKPLLEHYGYFALIISIALEGVGIPMPGQSLMFAASILSSEQVMNLTLVLSISWLSCFIGNTCGYLIGYYFEGWLNKKGYISGPKIQKLQAMIKRYGPLCLIVSRFVEGMKQFMPLACGVAKMPRSEFLLGNALATTIWVIVFGFFAYFAFEHLQLILQFYHHHRITVWCIFAALFFALLITLLTRRKHSN